MHTHTIRSMFRVHGIYDFGDQLNIYSEKATKSPNFIRNYFVTSKQGLIFCRIQMAFSKYMNCKQGSSLCPPHSYSQTWW